MTIAEILFAIASIPKGKRKNSLTQFFQNIFDDFENRILIFDTISAKHYARLAAMAKSKGRAFSVPDGYIAAIAADKSFFVASREASPFQAVNIGTINPWEFDSEQSSRSDPSRRRRKYIIVIPRKNKMVFYENIPRWLDGG